jgi:hypothetical protein
LAACGSSDDAASTGGAESAITVGSPLSTTGAPAKLSFSVGADYDVSDCELAADYFRTGTSSSPLARFDVSCRPIDKIATGYAGYDDGNFTKPYPMPLYDLYVGAYISTKIDPQTDSRFVLTSPRRWTTLSACSTELAKIQSPFEQIIVSAGKVNLISLNHGVKPLEDYGSAVSADLSCASTDDGFYSIVLALALNQTAVSCIAGGGPPPTQPPPPMSDEPTVSLTANGSTSLVVPVGTDILYNWSASNAVSTTTSLTISGGSDPCGYTSGDFSQNFPGLKGSLDGGALRACQTGKTYAFTMRATSASGNVAQSTLTIQVN